MFRNQLPLSAQPLHSTLLESSSKYPTQSALSLMSTHTLPALPRPSRRKSTTAQTTKWPLCYARRWRLDSTQRYQKSARSGCETRSWSHAGVCRARSPERQRRWRRRCENGSALRSLEVEGWRKLAQDLLLDGLRQEECCLSKRRQTGGRPLNVVLGRMLGVLGSRRQSWSRAMRRGDLREMILHGRDEEIDIQGHYWKRKSLHPGWL